LSLETRRIEAWGKYLVEMAADALFVLGLDDKCNDGKAAEVIEEDGDEDQGQLVRPCNVDRGDPDCCG
jgi:hypothetical protein